jgi:hypothetical protein
LSARREVAHLIVLLLPVVLAAGGCGPSPSVSGPPTASTSAAAAAPSASATPAVSPTTARSPGAVQSVAPRLTVDATLLEILPAQIDGVALEPDPATAAQIAGDPTLAGSALAIAVALAIRPGTSSGDDLAIVSVIRLRPGVFSETWFATWRSTYDEGACEVAGGIDGSPSQVSIGGHTVYVGTCAGDAQTYHVHLADPTLIVSITAAGPRRFGELVVAGLAR